MYEDIFLDVSKVLKSLERHHGDKDFQGKWKDKHWMNTPGPLYCGDTDNCGTGPYEAPNNVELDGESRQIIFRQPVNRYELRQVIQAAYYDPFSGYGVDGDLHWIYATIKGWWNEQRREVEQEVLRLHEARLPPGINYDRDYYPELSKWLVYLKDGMYNYLQVYAFFLDNGRIPVEGDRLPVL